MKYKKVSCYQTSNGELLTDVTSWRKREIELILTAKLGNDTPQEAVSCMAVAICDSALDIISVLRAGATGRPVSKTTKTPRKRKQAQGPELPLDKPAEPPTDSGVTVSNESTAPAQEVP